MEQFIHKQVKHTFLFNEGKWKAKGVFFDHENNPSEVEGEAVIEHTSDKWLFHNQFNFKDKQKNPIKNTYQIDPIQETRDFTFWRSDSHEFGTLHGRFMIIGDTILSSYQSESRIYPGTESLVKISDNKYIYKGFSFGEDSKQFSWEMEFERYSN